MTDGRFNNAELTRNRWCMATMPPWYPSKWSRLHGRSRADDYPPLPALPGQLERWLDSSW
jgi:hypothetical protein